MGKQRGSGKEWNNESDNKRFDNEVIIDGNSIIICQNFCVNAMVGGEQNLIIEEVDIVNEEKLFTNEESSHFEVEEEPKEVTPVRQDYTLIYGAPTDAMRSSLLMTVIARNMSENDVLVSIEDDVDALVEEVVPAKSELALTAQNALFVRALALLPSRVKFYISVFHPTSSY